MSGDVFKNLILFVDTIFDTFYALFSLIIMIIQNGWGNIQLTTALLQTTNIKSFVAPFVPMTYLTFKSIYRLFKEKRKLSKSHKKLTNNTSTTKNEGIAAIVVEERATTVKNQHSAESSIKLVLDEPIPPSIPSSPNIDVNCNISPESDGNVSAADINLENMPEINIDHQNWIDPSVRKGKPATTIAIVTTSPTTKISTDPTGSNSQPPQTGKKKCMMYDPNRSKTVRRMIDAIILTVSIFYLVLCCCINVTTFMYFKESNQACSNSKSSRILIEHPELYVWEHCSTAVLGVTLRIVHIVCA